MAGLGALRAAPSGGVAPPRAPSTVNTRVTSDGLYWNSTMVGTIPSSGLSNDSSIPFISVMRPPLSLSLSLPRRPGRPRRTPVRPTDVRPAGPRRPPATGRGRERGRPRPAADGAGPRSCRPRPRPAQLVVLAPQRRLDFHRGDGAAGAGGAVGGVEGDALDAAA